jgi:putative flavoprotein involved in K+ transport
MTATVAIIGGGQAGLAMSRCLSDRSIDHIVFERGRVGERWRSERWDSLRLLTPNWQSRLPGFRYDGPDPDGFMSMPELIHYLERYARSIDAPVRSDTRVTSVEHSSSGFRVSTDDGTWCSRIVIVATGHSDVPLVPAISAGAPTWMEQVVPTVYRRPDQLPPGGVLIVGASATGIQLAEEIQQSGRQVTLAVGRHTRLPRRYRGKDILWWLDRMGILGESIDAVYSVDISREQPSLQLVGRPDHASLDLGTLARLGVRLTGRLLRFEGDRAVFDDDLVATTAASDVKLAVLLGRIDGYVDRTGVDAPPQPGDEFEPSWSAHVAAPTALDLRAEGVRSVIWATGFGRRYPWLRVPVLDSRGEIRHEGGVTDVAGLYALGLHFLRHRNSSFIDGVGSDAEALAHHIDRVLREKRTA